jgi:hypothetical protein
MANAIYPKWKEAVIQHDADSALDGSGATGVYVALVDTGVYTYSAADQYYSSISAAVVGTPVELGTKTYTNGVLDAADIAFTAVSGSSVEALVLYIKNAGANTTWRLFAYLDTNITNLPVTPNGGDINVAWNASGIVGL